MAQVTSTVYKWIIDDVIAKMKPEVVQEGLEESVLDDLRNLWEAKLTEKGLLGPDGPTTGPSAQPVPPAIQIPPTMALAMGAPGGLGAGGPSGLGSISYSALAAAALAAAAGGGQPGLIGMKREAPDSGFQAMAAAAAAGMRPFMPQRDGACDECDVLPAGSASQAAQGLSAQRGALHRGAAGQLRTPTHQGKGPAHHPLIPQRDGEDEEEEEGEEGGQDGAEGGAGEAGEGEAPADDEELSSASDEEEEEDEDQPNFLCCQFEKVGRAKNKWKVAMKEGVFHINGKDYLFKKAQGEWIF